MVILNIELDNILLFQNFALNLSYPKKPVYSSIESEHLIGRPNFRYKKLVILMGANATGKTALGKALQGILNFISRKEAASLTRLIDNRMLPASFSIDLAFPDQFALYRISAVFKKRKNDNDEYTSDDIAVSVRHVNINKNDNYEACVLRLQKAETPEDEFYVKSLESVPHLSWYFEYPFASEGFQRAIRPVDPHVYADILRQVLQTLDPRIINVEEMPTAGNTYNIIYPNDNVLIQDGIIASPEKLSSGTKEGVGIAQLITGIKLDAHEFFYCDEKFSHVHTDLEKAFLSVMIDLLGDNRQMFFTTHNLDILEMGLPLHSFAFLRREDFPDHSIFVTFASEYIKKNNVSLRNAVENDLFSTIPSTSDVVKLAEA